MDELVKETLTESGKSARLTEKMTDIYDPVPDYSNNNISLCAKCNKFYYGSLL
jgi:hypothetical protein